MLVRAYIEVDQVDIPWKFLPYSAYPLKAATIFVLFLSTAYLTHIFFWILLGALIRPNDILPFASGRNKSLFLTPSYHRLNDPFFCYLQSIELFEKEIART
jgi:hypothetical protein